MIRSAIAFCLLISIATVLGHAQRVGVVLSGGAAKGIAHVGVLKALEENEIPIDYVVGTSIGGIVAGCYAAGMSPEQIEQIMLSPEFLGWVNGRLEQGYNNYYNRSDDNSSFLKINLSLDSTLNFNLNTTIAKDLSLNFALAETMAQPSAIAHNNFDSLFVPLRVVAADIFTQVPVILKKGNLSDALRATQTVPFFYNPIRVDGKYLFDGGVYNNFPVDVMQDEFNPDVIIGCNVSSKVYDEYPFEEDEQLISRSLIYLLLDKSDPARIPATGVYIQPDLKGFTSFDFSRARALIDSGYVQTMRQMEDIKRRISDPSFRTCDEVATSRNAFNNRAIPLMVDKINYVGFNSRQQQYLNRFFKSKRKPLYFSDIKQGYYKLVTDDYFRNIYPGFIYDPIRNAFDFNLIRRPQNNFQIDFGGVIATRNISSIFLGVNYYNFDRALTHAMANFYAGNFYKSAQLKARIDMPGLGRFYLEPEGTFNNWDFLEGRDIVLKNFPPTVLYRIDRKVGLSAGIPLGRRYKLSVNAHYVNNFDRFIDSEVLTSVDTLDELRLSGPRLGLSLSSNTLNRKQYASAGHAYRFSFDWFSLNESFVPGSTSVERFEEIRHHHSWIRGKVSMEQYFRHGKYSSGYLFQGVFSNQSAFTNYKATIINAPAFTPIQDGPTLLLQNFRAFSYLAGGWRNVYRLRKNLDFRLEGYAFLPFTTIREGTAQLPIIQSDNVIVNLAGTAGLVLHSSVGPISLSVNYYNDPENQIGVLLHVGFLLFQKTSLE